MAGHADSAGRRGAYARAVRVLLTGMSGTGKSTLVRELRARGHRALDADDDGFSEPRADGRWGWRVDRVADLLAREADGLLFFAGCSEEQATLPFDLRVLLTVPTPVLVARLRTRTGNRYGRDDAELAQVLGDLAEVEPLLRRSADVVLTTTVPPAELADRLLERLATPAPRPSGRRSAGPRTGPFAS
jgi:shikimate kinase